MVRRLLFILEYTQFCIFIPGKNIRPSAVMLIWFSKRYRVIGGNSTKKAEDTHSPSMPPAFESFSASRKKSLAQALGSAGGALAGLASALAKPRLVFAQNKTPI